MANAAWPMPHGRCRMADAARVAAPAYRLLPGEDLNPHNKNQNLECYQLHNREPQLRSYQDPAGRST